MSAESGCEPTRELIDEIALGIADAQERAQALEHVAGCPECGSRLRERSALADGLLMLAPAEEPPAGFERRALEGFEEAPRRRRLAPAIRLAAVAATAAALAGTAVWLAVADDRDVAGRYRETLAEVSGEDFDAASLYAPGEVEVGEVFGYQGSPSWTLVTVDSSSASMPSGTYRLQLVTKSGRQIDFEPIEIEDGRGSEGGAIPIDFHDVAEVRMLGTGPGEAYGARFAGEKD